MYVATKFAGAVLRGTFPVTVWENGFGTGATWPDWAWTPFIHSPVWNHFMVAVRRLADAVGTTPEVVVMASGVVAAGLCPLLIARGDLHTRAILVMAVAFTPSVLRPFEEYPTAKVLLVVAWLAYPRAARGGRHIVVFVAAAWLATMLHLSSWFFLGPAALTAVALRPGHRRPLALALVGLLAAFIATLFPTILDVFATGAGHRTWDPAPLLTATTVEWTMPLWFVPLVLYALPRVRGAQPWGAATAVGCIVFTIAHWWLMSRGYAIGGSFDTPGWALNMAHHHYFELIEPLLILSGYQACQGFSTTAPDRRGELAGVLAGVFLLTAQIIWMFYILNTLISGSCGGC